MRLLISYIIITFMYCIFLYFLDTSFTLLVFWLWDACVWLSYIYIYGGISWASWISQLVLFLIFGKYLENILSNISLFLSYPSGVPITSVLDYLILFYSSWGSVHFLKIFGCFCSSNWVICADPSSSFLAFFCHFHSDFKTIQRIFHFSYGTFQLQTFHLILFYDLYLKVPIFNSPCFFFL